MMGAQSWVTVAEGHECLISVLTLGEHKRDGVIFKKRTATLFRKCPVRPRTIKATETL